MMYKVLIVDDEPVVREGLSMLIDWKQHGYSVITMVENGGDALKELKRFQYDVVITDIRMPVMDGLELAKSIGELKMTQRVIIISGYNDFNYAKQAIEYGVKAYLLKPVMPDELIKHLQLIKIELDSVYKRSQEAISVLSEQKTTKIIDKILLYIEENYNKELNLKSIAAVFFLNPAYLGQLFKSTVGESFNDYLNRKRIYVAKELVQSKELLVYEIIGRVGFNDHQHFYKQFKRYEGISFAEYKQKFQ